MDVLPLLIVISLIVVALVVWLYFRMSSGGQFDDLESPAQRILLDDDAGPEREPREPSDKKGTLGRDAEGVEPARRGNTHRAGQPPEAKD
jgi:cbb3-type cytochrome oxidase maturation protein